MTGPEKLSSTGRLPPALRPAVIAHHRLGAHEQQACLPHSSGGEKSEMKAFVEGCLSGRASTFSLCPGMGEELRVPREPHL